MTRQASSTQHPGPNKKRYAAQGLLALGAVGLGVWGVVLSVGSGAQAQTTATEGAGSGDAQVSDPAVYATVKQMCEQVCLQPEDFSALGLTEAECEAALERLASWVKTNRHRLDEADLAITVAQSNLNELQRKIRTGEATEEEITPDEITAKRKAIGKAQADQKALMLEGGSTAVRATVARDKADRWEKAQTWAAILPAEVRYLPDMDMRRLEAILRERGRRGVPLEEVLTFSEKQAADEAKARIEQQKQTMTAAWQRAVPSRVSADAVPE